MTVPALSWADAAFLAAAPPDDLLRVLPAVGAQARERRVAAAYRSPLHLPRHAQPAARARLLALETARFSPPAMATAFTGALEAARFGPPGLATTEAATVAGRPWATGREADERLLNVLAGPGRRRPATTGR
ncbi:hypothetical protein [Streptomyces sp. NPDC006012]|uniref:hypothetical protein n=1 Tax=Streptomyces sp. NPDC006012 TaxID=3364739 RepID=UPI003681119B